MNIEYISNWFCIIYKYKVINILPFREQGSQCGKFGKDVETSFFYIFSTTDGVIIVFK